MIKAIVFDMGGVLLNLDIELCKKNFREKAGFEDIGDYLDVFHQKGFIGDLEAGLITVEDFLSECHRHSRPDVTDETILDCFCSLLIGINPETVALIGDLREKGYPLYILSNNNPISVVAFKNLMLEQGVSVDEVFTKQFYSFEMKLLKPFPEIYQRAIEEIGCKAEEILFIDDSQKNLDGAQALGIRPYLYVRGGEIRKKILEVL